MKNKIDILKSHIHLARDAGKGTLLLKNGRLVNVYSGEVHETNILVDGNTIIGTSHDYFAADKIIDLRGLYVLPGFIDGHIHIESSLLSVREFARLLLLNGTTTIIADPHEIANVMGAKGIDYMLEASKNLPLDIFLTIPSCVPSTNMETSGGSIAVKDINKYLANPRILGLAEVMNFPGVITGAPEVLEKIAVTAECNKIIDGHCPRLYGKYLQAYVGAGISSDHESTDAREALEKLRLGMRIMIREGSAAKNLSDLIPMVNIRNSRRIFFASDDKHPDELISFGHLNSVLRKAVSMGLDSVTAIQMVTLNPAEYFNLKDRGAIAPGKIADMMVVDNLTDFNVQTVIKNGEVIVQNRKLETKLADYKDKAVLNTMKVKPFTLVDLKVKAKQGLINVIRIIPDQIITEKYTTNPKIVGLKKTKPGSVPSASLWQKAEVVSDLERDIIKIVVVERHKRTGNIAVGFVTGMGMKKGAIASSIAHDSHNIIAVGVEDKDIYIAIKEVIKLGGGLVAVDKGKVKESLALPIAGIMTDKPAEEVAGKLRDLVASVRTWGTKIDNPFMTLSFLALPVIPALKITDKGLVDVSQFKIIKLFE